MSRPAVVLAFSVVVLMIVAGCATPGAMQDGPAPAAALPAEWYAPALNHEEGHDHKDILQHENLSTPNFRLLGHNPLLTDHYNGKPAQGYGCGGWAQTDAGRRLSVVNAFQNDLTFVLVDVTDATNPVKVGEFYAQGMGSYDADLTPDGLYVALAFDQQLRAPLPEPHAAPMLTFRGECAGAPEVKIALPMDAVVTAGIVLVSVKDPAHPEFVDWDPLPGRNLHSVSTARIDNVTWVIGSELGGVPKPGPTTVVPVSTGYHGLSYFVFDQVQDSPAGTKLMRVGQWDSPPASTSGDNPTVPIRNGHTDIALMKHPKTGQLLGFVADWEGGVVLLDMANPMAPQVISTWVPPHALGVNPNGDGPCYRTAIHEVLPAPQLWDGKHYLFAGQECPMKTDTKAPGGSVFVLDDTDPTQLKLVGEWHLPEDTGVWTVEYQASPHYLALVNRTLFISDYHAGIWAADVSTDAALKSPPSIGVYMPAIPLPEMPDETGVLPMDEQVDALPDGTLLIIEDTTGLYAVKFDASDPAPPAAPYPYAK